VLGGPAQRFLTDGERARVQRFRFLVPALIAIESRQVVEAHSGVRVIGPSAFSQMARARAYSTSAFSYRP